MKENQITQNNKMNQKTLITALINECGSIKKLAELSEIKVQRWYEWRNGKYDMSLNTYLETLEKIKKPAIF